MSVPMPYAQVQVQPVAQLMEPTIEQVRKAQASLLTMPVSSFPLSVSCLDNICGVDKDQAVSHPSKTATDF